MDIKISTLSYAFIIFMFISNSRSHHYGETLKKVYTAVDEEAALDALDSFAAAWDSKYPKISKSWYEKTSFLQQHMGTI